MKAFLSVLLFWLTVLPVQSQVNIDSLKETFNNTVINRYNLQNHLALMQAMKPNETDGVEVIGEWVIKNANTDSLRELFATTNLVLGKIFINVLDFEKAARYLTVAQSISEKNNYFTIQADVLNALGAIYGRNNQELKAISFYEKSLDISEKNNYLRGISFAKYNLGWAQMESGKDLKPAMNLMLQGFSIAKQLNDTQSIITQSSALIGAYIALKNYDSASSILKDAEMLIKASGNEISYIQHFSSIARIYRARKKYPEAIKYYNTGLTLAKKYDIPRWKCMYYDGLAVTYEQMGDYKNANLYNQLNIRMHDALVNKENFAAAADIQNKYDRAKKDNEILKLAAENKQRSILNKVFIGSSIGLLLISLLVYRNYRKGQQLAKNQVILQKQKIKELEKDKQLLATSAMLKGQEEERSRIAKDLHDGLGGLLSGTKLSLLNVRDNLVLTARDMALFDKSLSMLDNTICDLRKVAQNLMPEALVKYGLNEAVRDFCDSIKSSSSTEIKFQEFGRKRKLDNTTEVFAYRIIQELVNNAVKHAEASEVFVQLAMNDNKIGITVEDNGKGFDKNNIATNKGAGLANIKYRAQYLNGTSDIISSEGNGTSVHIELVG